MAILALHAQECFKKVLQKNYQYHIHVRISNKDKYAAVPGIKKCLPNAFVFGWD